MKMLLFAIRDSKVEAFMNPFPARATGEAIRGFSDAVNDGKGEFWRHAADYTLFTIGTFDDQTGLIEVGSHGPVVIGNGATFQVKDPQLKLEVC